MTEDPTDYHSDSQYQFEYYDEEKRVFKKLPEAATLPERASLVVAERKLYAVQAHSKDESQQYIFQYNAKQNTWKQLPPMNESHGSDFNVVHLDGYIYIIGDSMYSGLAERFNIAEREWEMLSNLPYLYEWTSAMAYKGKILVYGTRSSSHHEIHQYDPSTDTWQIVLSHSIPRNVIQHYPSPVLFEYQDKVYRVLFQGIEQCPNYHTPIVNELNIHSSSGRISVGEEVNQDVVAGNNLHAFCIQDEIFINARGFIQRTDLIMSDGEVDDPIAERIWTEFRLHLSIIDACNAVCFTFDKKKLGWIP